MWNDDYDYPPTANELLRWEADSIGEHHPDREWVLTDYDVWMRNPHYTGVRTNGHPEDHDRDVPAPEPVVMSVEDLDDQDDRWPDDLPF